MAQAQHTLWWPVTEGPLRDLSPTHGAASNRKFPGNGSAACCSSKQAVCAVALEVSLTELAPTLFSVLARFLRLRIQVFGSCEAVNTGHLAGTSGVDRPRRVPYDDFKRGLGREELGHQSTAGARGHGLFPTRRGCKQQKQRICTVSGITVVLKTTGVTAGPLAATRPCGRRLGSLVPRRHTAMTAVPWWRFAVIVLLLATLTIHGVGEPLFGSGDLVSHTWQWPHLPKGTSRHVSSTPLGLFACPNRQRMSCEKVAASDLLPTLPCTYRQRCPRGLRDGCKWRRGICCRV
jgi:hypothetical protein